MKLASLLLAFAAPLAACGGNVVSQSSSGSMGGASGTSTGTGAAGTSTSTGAAGTSTSTGTGTSTGTSSGSGSPCPAAEPQGGACSLEGFRCTYGDSVRADCRSAVTCMGGMWVGETTACSMSTVCNQFKTPPAGQACDPSAAQFCVIGDTLCGCSQCLEGPCMAGPVTWQCAGPPSTPGCPPVIPNDGSPCTSPGVLCSYGYPCGGSGANAACKDGLWRWTGQLCAG